MLKSSRKLVGLFFVPCLLAEPLQALPCCLPANAIRPFESGLFAEQAVTPASIEVRRVIIKGKIPFQVLGAQARVASADHTGVDTRLSRRGFSLGLASFSLMMTRGFGAQLPRTSRERVAATADDDVIHAAVQIAEKAQQNLKSQVGAWEGLPPQPAPDREAVIMVLGELADPGSNRFAVVSDPFVDVKASDPPSQTISLERTVFPLQTPGYQAALIVRAAVQSTPSQRDRRRFILKRKALFLPANAPNILKSKDLQKDLKSVLAKEVRNLVEAINFVQLGYMVGEARDAGVTNMREYFHAVDREMKGVVNPTRYSTFANYLTAWDLKVKEKPPTVDENALALRVFFYEVLPPHEKHLSQLLSQIAQSEGVQSSDPAQLHQWPLQWLMDPAFYDAPEKSARASSTKIPRGVVFPLGVRPAEEKLLSPRFQSKYAAARELADRITPIMRLNYTELRGAFRTPYLLNNAIDQIIEQHKIQPRQNSDSADNHVYMRGRLKLAFYAAGWTSPEAVYELNEAQVRDLPLLIADYTASHPLTLPVNETFSEIPIFNAFRSWYFTNHDNLTNLSWHGAYGDVPVSDNYVLLPTRVAKALLTLKLLPSRIVAHLLIRSTAINYVATYQPELRALLQTALRQISFKGRYLENSRALIDQLLPLMSVDPFPLFMPSDALRKRNIDLLQEKYNAGYQSPELAGEAAGLNGAALKAAWPYVIMKNGKSERALPVFQIFQQQPKRFRLVLNEWLETPRAKSLLSAWQRGEFPFAVPVEEHWAVRDMRSSA